MVLAVSLVTCCSVYRSKGTRSGAKKSPLIWKWGGFATRVSGLQAFRGERRASSHRGALTMAIKRSLVVGNKTVKILCKFVSYSNQNDRNTHLSTRIDSHVDYAVLPPHRYCPTKPVANWHTPEFLLARSRRLRAKRR